jgi:anti-anti-sigma regulatory factor
VHLDDEAAARVELDDSATPVRLLLVGAVGAYHSDELYAAALRALERQAAVVVDCRELTHLGAAALQLLLALRGALADRGLALATRAVPPALAPILTMSGLP